MVIFYYYVSSPEGKAHDKLLRLGMFSPIPGFYLWMVYSWADLIMKHQPNHVVNVPGNGIGFTTV